MKTFIIFLSLLFSSILKAQITIVSDLDDTIKITQASGEISDYLGSDVYTGMPEFFKAAKSYSQSLHVLSASPSVLKPKIECTLDYYGIDYKSLILRRNVSEKKFNYKFRKIKQLIENSTDDFLFIGDDIGKDPEVYTAIRDSYPDRVIGIYIHVVNGRPLEGVIPYWTSFDLAMREYMSYRMPPQKVEEIASKLLAEQNLLYVFPLKAQCPTDGIPWGWQTRTIFMKEAFELMKRYVNFCKVR